MNPSALGPLPFLVEEWPLRDLVILDFNANLGFFERAGLAKARSRGARVTLVSDVDMVFADPEATRFAGRSYLDARAVCPGGTAFHPKLVVAIGNDQAAVLVGSGNTSPGGWISNAELWTMLRASRAGAPRTVDRVADFLEALVPQLRLTAGAAEVLREVAGELSAFDATTDGPTLVSSVFGPILAQLPSAGPVDELVLSAPFFDRKAEAVAALVDHFDPVLFEVVVGEAANYDGEALQPIVAARGGTISTIAGVRYHHAKLVEWRIGERRYALTGSPNLSSHGLLEALGSGGNCELGLIAEIPESLRPATSAELDANSVRSHQWRTSVASAEAERVLILDVALSAQGLRLDLRAPLDEPATLQFHNGSSWVNLAVVPAGVIDPTIEPVLDGGKSVRLLLADGTSSAPRGVTDLARTKARPVTARQALPGNAEKFVFDPRYVSMMETALNELRVYAPAVAPVAHASTAPHAAAARVGWREYITALRAEVGDDFGFFVLPHIMKAAGIEAPEDQQEPGFERVEVGGEGQEDVEIPGEAAKAGTESPGAELARRVARVNHENKTTKAKQRARFRSLTQRLVKDAAKRPEAVRIAAAVLTAGGAALGCWERGSELADRLRDSVLPLIGAELQPEFRRDAASITAVVLAVMRAQTRQLSDATPAALTFQKTAEQARPLLAYVERSDVEYRSAGLLTESLIQLADVRHVMEIVESVIRADPLEDAVDVLADDGIAAEVDGRVVEVLGTVRDAVTTALRAVAAAQEASPVAAMAHDPRGAVVAVWEDPYLVVVQRRGKVLSAIRYPLSRLRPRGYLLSRSQDTSPPGTERFPGQLSEPEVRAALVAVGVDFGAL